MRGILRLIQGKNLLFKSFWLFFPSLLFVLILWQYLWTNVQQKTLLIELIQSRFGALLFLLLLLLYVLTTWYIGRLLVYGRHAFSGSLYRHFKKQEYRSGIIRKNAAPYLQLIFSLPRIGAFVVFSLAWIYILFLAPLPNNYNYAKGSVTIAYILLGVSIVLYTILYRVAIIIREKTIERSHGNYITDEDQKRRKNLILLTYFFLICLLLTANTIIQNHWLLVFSILLLQLLFPFIIVIRRAYSDLRHTWYDHWMTSMKKSVEI